MKVLFVPFYITTPHFETELELVLDHINNNDEVYILNCKEELKTCLINPKHLKSICYSCKKKNRKGISLVNSSKVNLLSFEKHHIDYSSVQNSFNNIDELKNYKFKNINFGLSVASTLISRFNHEHILDTFYYAEQIKTELKNSIFIYENLKIITERIGPDLVYLFNGRFSIVLPILEHCEKSNIKYYTHERGGIPERYTLFERATPHDTLYVQNEIEDLWNSGGKDKYEVGSSFFIDRRNRITQGWVSFTKNQINNELPINFPINKTIITVYNSTIEEYASVRGWEKPFRFFSDENDGLLKIFEFFKDDNTIQFYLRIHPNLFGFENTQMKQIKSLISKYKNVEIIMPESKIDTYALLEKSDKIIVMGSTVGVEASYWGKPVIALGKAYYEKLNCCYWPDTFSEFVEMIKQNLKPKDQLEAVKYGYWELTRGHQYKYYKAETLFNGKFLSEYIEMNNFQKVIFYLLKILEVKNMNKLFKMGYKFFFR